MKISKIIACILSLLLRAWITASAAVMMYIQMSVLAYARLSAAKCSPLQ